MCRQVVAMYYYYVGHNSQYCLSLIRTIIVTIYYEVVSFEKDTTHVSVTAEKFQPHTKYVGRYTKSIETKVNVNING